MSGRLASRPDARVHDPGTGGETAALPAIWTSKADFEARLAKWGEESRGQGGRVSDLASFRTAFAEVTKNCGGCHELYRARRN